MSEFVFDPTKAYGRAAKCNDVGDDELAKHIMESDARRFIPDDHMGRVRFWCYRLDPVFDKELLEDGAQSLMCWKYTPPPLILDNNWPIKIEVKP